MGLETGIKALTTRDSHQPPVIKGRINELLQPSTQALSGAGAVDLTKSICLFTSTGAAQALTIADGSEVGERHRIMHVVDGGSGVITHNGTTINLANSVASITFTNKGDWAELLWNGSAWVVIGLGGATLA